MDTWQLLNVFIVVCSWDLITAGFMEKFLRFKRPKMKEAVCFLSTLLSMVEWSRSCSVVRSWQYLLSLNNGIFIISFGYCKREFRRSSSSALMQSSRKFTLLWPVNLTISERKMFAFLSLLTFVFLALWYVNFLVTNLKASTNYGFFSLWHIRLSSRCKMFHSKIT